MDSEENAFGEATAYELTHPHMLLTVDKTGSNTNQKLDGHIGGQLFLVGADEQEVGNLGAATDIHFTVLVFTAGTSEPVMVGGPADDLPTNFLEFF